VPSILIPLTHPHQYSRDDLPLMMLPRPANQARKLNAITASRTPRRRQYRRLFFVRIASVQPAPPAGDRIDNAPANAQPQRDLAMRHRPFVDQKINLVDECKWQHRKSPREVAEW
jgi:hypothetical protein